MPPADAHLPVQFKCNKVARKMRLAAAIEWYREGRVSQGQGAEIAGLDRVEFLDELLRAKMPACQVTVDEADGGSRPCCRDESSTRLP
jgi:hypothetical protein